jgi:hypothetical protein
MKFIEAIKCGDIYNGSHQNYIGSHHPGSPASYYVTHIFNFPKEKSE